MTPKQKLDKQVELAERAADEAKKKYNEARLTLKKLVQFREQMDQLQLFNEE